MDNDYLEFLAKKDKGQVFAGLSKIPELNSNLFDFQQDIVKWNLLKGRSSLFAGTGLGKSLMELSWCDAIVKETNKKCLIFTPLAVAQQMEQEAEKFGIDARHVYEQTNDKIQITNYQKIDHFDLSEFETVVLDESSILKNETGHFRTRLINECRKIRHRLAATATPSPNDFMELGNHSEFCGVMSFTDMLASFFTHDGSSTQKWRLKGHAESKFWEWMASWSVMLENPKDLGYDGSKYDLPTLHKIQHTVRADYSNAQDAGMLFPIQALGMGDRLKVRRVTMNERCEEAAQIVNKKPNDTWVLWCNLNDESALINDLLPGSVQLVGSMKEEKKEEILLAFSKGEIKQLITKPSLTGFGLNWQHCHNTAFIGLNDSFEQIYQAVRRFWRFGQKNEVYAHFIASELEGNVVSNIQRKEKQAAHMMQQMVKHMADLNADNIRGTIRDTLSYIPNEEILLPEFL